MEENNVKANTKEIVDNYRKNKIEELQFKRYLEIFDGVHSFKRILNNFILAILILNLILIILRDILITFKVEPVLILSLFNLILAVIVLILQVILNRQSSKLEENMLKKSGDYDNLILYLVSTPDKELLKEAKEYFNIKGDE